MVIEKPALGIGVDTGFLRLTGRARPGAVSLSGAAGGPAGRPSESFQKRFGVRVGGSPRDRFVQE
ncbi:hypothetical protein GCM10020369_82190 [Cryptosporangium minutisporangium]|uniref:Uncharacterized protein n=1 Tax=Cryptosporangium minutisporangium TaxID=113569 RepID=A0ABP6TD93_9ACTN